MTTDRHGQEICTTNGKPVDEVLANQTESTGQHAGYLVLCPDERAKGFVRPYRDEYKHVGERPTYPIRDLTPDQLLRYQDYGYIKFEAYPEDSIESNNGTSSGRYWTDAMLKSGCGTTTKMGRDLSETYARDPEFYGSTFCVRCNVHRPVAEFVWTMDGLRVGS